MKGINLEILFSMRYFSRTQQKGDPEITLVRAAFLK